MKCVVSLSGGRDSSTCLGLAVERYGAENVVAMGFEYGSTHPQELKCAQKIADYFGVPFKVVSIDSTIFKGSTCTMLQESENTIQKDKTYSEILTEKEGKVDTYVPARNTLFSAYVLARAESLVEETNDDVVVMLGQHADDSGFYIDENGVEQLDYTKAAYPDCSWEYVKAFAKVAEISSVGRITYEAPFAKKHKWELIKLGLELKKRVPYEMCLSCYDPIETLDGEVKECLRCATCLDCIDNMNKALDAIEKENPTLYEEVKNLRISQ